MDFAQAARFGFLVGKGASIGGVHADPLLFSRSERSLSHAATSWSLKFGADEAPTGNDDATLAVPIPPADLVLTDAAAARGLSPESFAADLIHVISRDGLFVAVMHDEVAA